MDASLLLSLPDDLLLHVLLIYSATRIQGAYRRSMYRHVHRRGWCRLLSLLVRSGTYGRLHANEMVRREWKREVESWIYCAEKERGTLAQIAEEVEQGYWRVA